MSKRARGTFTVDSIETEASDEHGGVVIGRVDGREGSFIVRHSATEAGDERALNLAVVRATGTGELSGLSGSMTIDIDADGGHSYTLDHELG